jgi:hypothetical protein
MIEGVQKVHSLKMFTKRQISQNLWKIYASIGWLGSASIFTSNIVLKSNFTRAGGLLKKTHKFAHKYGRLKMTL